MEKESNIDEPKQDDLLVKTLKKIKSSSDKSDDELDFIIKELEKQAIEKKKDKKPV